MFSTLIAEENKRIDSAATQKQETEKLKLKLKRILMKQVTDLIVDDFNQAGFVFHQKPEAECNSANNAWSEPAYMGVNRYYANDTLEVVRYTESRRTGLVSVGPTVPEIVKGISENKFTLDRTVVLKIEQCKDACGYQYAVHIKFPNHARGCSKIVYTLDPVEAVQLLSADMAKYVKLSK